MAAIGPDYRPDKPFFSVSRLLARSRHMDANGSVAVREPASASVEQGDDDIGRVIEG